MKIHSEVGLSFDDVLLVPKRNSFGSRKNVSLKSRLTKNISLSIPIVSANMDTVTGSRLAIVMAQNGGMGIIHRFNTIEEEAAEVRIVKRQSSYIIKEPYTIDIGRSVGDARAMSHAYGVSGFPVVDGKRLVGIVTNRDLWFQRDETPINGVMTKIKDMVVIEKRSGMEDNFVDMCKRLIIYLKLFLCPDFVSGL